MTDNEIYEKVADILNDHLQLVDPDLDSVVRALYDEGLIVSSKDYNTKILLKKAGVI